MTAVSRCSAWHVEEFVNGTQTLRFLIVVGPNYDCRSSKIIHKTHKWAEKMVVPYEKGRKLGFIKGLCNIFLQISWLLLQYLQAYAEIAFVRDSDFCFYHEFIARDY